MSTISWNRLSTEDKQSVQKMLDVRAERYLQLSGSQRITTKFLLVGDRPGPSAPQTDDYHHTPFYSTKYCSGWLNSALFLEGIDENNLLWVNSADWRGYPTNSSILEHVVADQIIALGGAAAAWCKKAGVSFVSVHHPQFHKRFKAAERYALLDILR